MADVRIAAAEDLVRDVDAIPSPRRWLGTAALPTVLAGAALLAFAASFAFPGLVRLPDNLVFPAGTLLGRFFDFVVYDLKIGPATVSDITRGAASAIALPVTWITSLLTDGLDLTLPGGTDLSIPAFPWFGTVSLLVVAAYALAGPGPALLAALTLAYVVLCGLWPSTITTLVSVLFAVVLGVGLGLVCGILGYRSRMASRLLDPFYDTLQTLPVFSYLSLILLLFGFGPVSALIATIIFAMPPMARATEMALRSTPTEIKELGVMAGCTRRQHLWLVEIPTGRPQLLLGVNQVIMLSLGMVIIASIIGAGGLGADVLRSLKSMRMSQAVQSGLAITFLAISLDRVSFAWATRSSYGRPAHGPRLLALAGAIVVGAAALAAFAPDLGSLSERAILDFGRSVDRALASFDAVARPGLALIQSGTVVWALRPIRTLAQALPWLPTVLAVAALAAAVGNRWLAATCAALLAGIAIFGLWDKAMLSLYLVLASIAFAFLIGFPIGIVAGLSGRLYRIALLFTDTIQTLPNFVYLIPVVVLFGVGDFPSFVAIVLYTLAPVIRYTATGIRHVPHHLREAATMTGCTPGQRLRHVLLPLALPQILLGLNQATMLGFGMLVITALVGSRGLEETTLVAVAKVLPGEGLVAGFGIAALAIVIDRLLRAASRRLARRLGIQQGAP